PTRMVIPSEPPRPNGVVGRQKAVLRAKVVRGERHGYQELRGVHEGIRSFRALTKSRPFWRLKKSRSQANFTMTKKHGVLALVGICLLIVVLSAAGLASDFLTRLDLDLDGLLLILCSLLMGLLFLIALVVIAKEQGWIPQRHKKESAGTPAPKPAAPRAAPAKPPSEEAVSVRPG